MAGANIRIKTFSLVAAAFVICNPICSI